MQGYRGAVLRDANNNCNTVCNMECSDPMGTPIGVYIVTLVNAEYSQLRTCVLQAVRNLGVVSATFNVQWIHHSQDFRIIEVNAGLSGSSAEGCK